MCSMLCEGISKVGQKRELLKRACVKYLIDFAETMEVKGLQTMPATALHRAIVTSDVDFCTFVLKELATAGNANTILNTPLNFHELPEDVIIEGCLMSVDGLRVSLKGRTINPMNTDATFHEADHEGKHDQKCKCPRHVACPEIGDKFGMSLALAAMAGKKSIFLLLLSFGADIYQMDRAGNNIVHSLVNWSSTHPQIAIEMYAVVIDTFHTSEEKEQLLKHENISGQTPLDLAATLYAPEMMLAILNTEGVYRFVAKDCLLHRHILYDLSAYEGPEKARQSPLFYCQSITESDVIRFAACNFFETEPVKTWIKARWQTYKYDLYIVYIYWAIYIILYLTQLTMYLVHGHPHLAVNIFLIYFSVNILLCDAVVWIRSFRQGYSSLRRMVYKGKYPATFTMGYRLLQYTFSLLVVIVTIFHLTKSECQNSDAIRVIHCFTSIYCFLSILYFSQLNTHMGHLLITIQRMIYEMCVFIGIGTIIFFAIATAFAVLQIEPPCTNATSSDVNNDSKLETVFQTCSNVLYDTFLLSLAIAAPGPGLFNTNLSGLALFIYIISVLLISILLINLLIGIMGQRVIDINKYKSVFQILQEISIVQFIEQRNIWFNFWNIKLACKKSKYFQCSGDLSKVLLHVTEDGPPVELTHVTNTMKEHHEPAKPSEP